MAGKFVVSLDFELMWGVRDVRTIGDYGPNVSGVHKVIPRLLDCFDAFNVKGTFATVGFLFFETKNELIGNFPAVLPAYRNPALSPYDENYIRSLGDDYKSDKYHFAPDLVELIRSNGNHEIGTHTFCHYYCLEEGQTITSFKSDLQQAILVAQKKGISISSIVFPRNQFNEAYLEVLKELDIICYRGCEDSWIYEAQTKSGETRFRRSIRLMDAYINISGHNCYSNAYMQQSFPVNIPSSRFLRPYSPRLKFLENLRLKRIKSGMTHAARNDLTYHLWWHPHNFGIHQDENFAFLKQILQHYKALELKYNFRSITMTDLAKELIDGK